MPSIDRVGAVRITIYLNDHRPAHVHAVKGRCKAVLILNCPFGPPGILENVGFSRAEMRRILEQCLARITDYCKQWEQLHGSNRQHS